MDQPPKGSASPPAAPEDATVSPTQDSMDPQADKKQEDGTGDASSPSDDETGDGSSAQAPASEQDDEKSKNFGFVFDSGMVTYFFVLVGLALCVCPFAAWQCFSRPKKVAANRMVQPDIEVINMEDFK